MIQVEPTISPQHSRARAAIAETPTRRPWRILELDPKIESRRAQSQEDPDRNREAVESQRGQREFGRPAASCEGGPDGKPPRQKRSTKSAGKAPEA